MSRTRSLGIDFLLALALVTAWVPAAMIATPAAQASADAAPAEGAPALDEGPADPAPVEPSRA